MDSIIKDMISIINGQEHIFTICSDDTKFFVYLLSVNGQIVAKRNILKADFLTKDIDFINNIREEMIEEGKLFLEKEAEIK